LRRRGKNITTRRREGVGVVVDKMKKVDELSTKIRVIHLYSNNAHRNSGCPIQKNKQFNKKTKL